MPVPSQASVQPTRVRRRHVPWTTIPPLPAPSEAAAPLPPRLLAADPGFAADGLGEPSQPPLDGVADQPLFALLDEQGELPVVRCKLRLPQHRRHPAGEPLAEPHREAPAMRSLQLPILAQLAEPCVRKTVASEIRRQR